MYFARTEFNPDPTVEAEALRYAAEAVQSAERYFGVVLNGGGESVARVEQILGRVQEMLAATGLSREAAEPFARLYGSYFGEVVRARYGGTWGIARIYSDRIPALQVSPRDVVLVPWVRARERITEGPEKSLWDYYQRIVGSLEQPQAESATEAVAGRQFYTLRHDQGYFQAGVTADGRQVLMDDLLAVFFDADGNLLGYEFRPQPFEPERDPRSGNPLPTAEDRAAVKTLMEAWQREIGFYPQPIRVRRFSVPENGIGIDDRPDHFEEFLKAPELEEPDEDERREMFESIREWDECGNFVLYWGNDLWLDGDGVVESS